MGQMERIVQGKEDEPKKAMFRKLRADEIECRVATVSEKGCSLLLYKDARCDMRILDEVFGVYGWQRKHELIDGQLFCTVSVFDPHMDMWVSKQDVGTESYTEKEKGRASDSFKRACFNLGIGRELYSAPFIWIKAGDVNLTQKNGKFTTYDRFRVKEIGYDDNGNINQLTIISEKGKVVYSLGKKVAEKEEAKEEQPEVTDEAKKLAEKISKKDIELLKKTISEESIPAWLKHFGKEKAEDLTKLELGQIYKYVQRKREEQAKAEKLKEKVDGNQSENQ